MLFCNAVVPADFCQQIGIDGDFNCPRFVTVQCAFCCKRIEEKCLFCGVFVEGFFKVDGQSKINNNGAVGCVN